jgi:hypothetical protein
MEDVMRSGLWTAVLVCLCCSGPARAALYEYTFEGTVTRSRWPDAAVGDPFVVRYTVGSTDLNPSPTAGKYAASPAVAVLPRVTLRCDPGELLVFLDSAWGDTVFYYSLLDVGEFTTDIRYPRGTFATDSLPLELPLDAATWTIWQYGGDFIADYAGTITGSSVVEVPEPNIAIAALLALPVAVGRRSRCRQCSPPGHAQIAPISLSAEAAGNGWVPGAMITSVLYNRRT